MRILLVVLFFTLPLLVKAQEIPPELRKKMEEVPPDSTLRLDQGTLFYPDVPKGKITGWDETVVKFTNLIFSADSVTFTNMRGTMTTKPLNEIREVAESIPKAGQGALYGTAVGAVTGFLTGILAYPENNFWETLGQLFSSDEDVSPKISKKAVPLMIGITAGGAAIGALVGAGHQETIYGGFAKVAVYPEIIPIPGNTNGLMLTWAIPF